MDSNYTVCVDLDGTLVCTDTLHRSLYRLFKTNPLRALVTLMSIPAGKARFKQVVACASPIDAASLPYRQDLLAWLRSERLTGRKLILATGADREVAHAVANYLGLFDAVVSSNGVTNMTGPRKAAEILRLLDDEPFVYAGDSDADMAIWRVCKSAVVVNPDAARLAALRRARVPILRTF